MQHVSCVNSTLCVWILVTYIWHREFSNVCIKHIVLSKFCFNNEQHLPTIEVLCIFYPQIYGTSSILIFVKILQYSNIKNCEYCLMRVYLRWKGLTKVMLTINFYCNFFYSLALSRNARLIWLDYMYIDDYLESIGLEPPSRVNVESLESLFRHIF